MNDEKRKSLAAARCLEGIPEEVVEAIASEPRSIVRFAVLSTVAQFAASHHADGDLGRDLERAGVLSREVCRMLSDSFYRRGDGSLAMRTTPNA